MCLQLFKTVQYTTLPQIQTYSKKAAAAATNAAASGTEALKASPAKVDSTVCFVLDETTLFVVPGVTGKIEVFGWVGTTVKVEFWFGCRGMVETTGNVLL